MSRRPIIAGNWKMHLTIAEAEALAAGVRDRCARHRHLDVVIAPPATALWAVARRLGETSIGLAAQNCYWESHGAFTGELSPAQLGDAGCGYVIVGHSERRQLFGETNEGVGQKVRALHDQGLIPIACVGETLEQREGGQTTRVVLAQLDAALAALQPDEVARTVVAYEPVWAIGTGRTATPAQAQDVHAALRARLATRHGEAVAAQVRLQYGGSVKPDNIVALMAEPDIDGALVGGASLSADSFAAIVNYRQDD